MHQSCFNSGRSLRAPGHRNDRCGCSFEILTSHEGQSPSAHYARNSASTTNDELDPRRSKEGDKAGAGVAVVKFVGRYAVLVVGAFFAIAVAANVLVPFWTAFTAGQHDRATVGHRSTLSDRPAFPAHMGNVAYIVVDSSAAPTPTDTYLNELVKRLRGTAPNGVRAVVNQSSDPLTAPVAQSDDGRVAYIDVELDGVPGSPESNSAVHAVQAVVDSVAAPTGVHAYISGPGGDAAAAAATANTQAPWLALIVFGAMVILIVVVTRRTITSVAVLASATIALLIALPVHAMLASPVVSPFGAAMTVALTMGSTLHYSRLIGSGARPIIASASILVVGLAAITIAGSAQLLALGISTAIGAAVGVLLSYVCAARWKQRVDDRIHPPPTRRLSRRLTALVYRHPQPALIVSAVVVIAVMTQLPRIDAVLASPQSAPPNSTAALGSTLAADHFGDDRLQPLSVVLRTDHDLRNPAGLLGIDRVTRRLIELPAATRVQSAAWPGGLPWPQATVAHQISELNRRLQSEGLSTMPLTGSILGLPTSVDELSSTIDQFGAELNTGSAGLSATRSSLTALRSSLDRIEGSLSELSGYADPLRRFVAGNPNCATDPVCSSTQRVIEPLDGLLADTSSVVASTKTLPDSVTAAGQILTSASSTLLRVRTDLAQFRSLADEFAKTTRSALPEATKATSLIDAMTADLSNSGGGGFYLPQSEIDGPDYARVKARMFSTDGHATRILVYVSEFGASNLSQPAVWAVQQSTKYGDLAGATVETEPTGSAEPMRIHRVTDLATPALLLAAVIFLAAGLALRSALLGAAAAGSTLVCVAAGLGAAALLASMPTGRIDWSTPVLALVTAPVVAEDAFWLARRWAHRWGDQAPRALTMHSSALSIATAIGAAAVIGATALTSANLDYAGAAVMCCLAVSYLSLRVWLIAATSSARA